MFFWKFLYVYISIRTSIKRSLHGVVKTNICLFKRTALRNFPLKKFQDVTVLSLKIGGCCQNRFLRVKKIILSKQKFHEKVQNLAFVIFWILRKFSANVVVKNCFPRVQRNIFDPFFVPNFPKANNFLRRSIEKKLSASIVETVFRASWVSFWV